MQVISPHGQYGSQGNFACPEDYKLFDENGFKSDTSTHCNQVAEWENSKGLRCWTGGFCCNIQLENIED